MSATDSRITVTDPAQQTAAEQTARGPEPGPMWQSIWFEARRADWRSIALVAAEPGLSTREAAAELTEVAKTFEAGGAVMVDGTRLGLGSARLVLEAIDQGLITGARVVVALDAPHQAPAVIPVARSADAALLVVRLGETSLDAARDAVDRIGRDLFIGSIALRAGKDSASSKRGKR